VDTQLSSQEFEGLVEEAIASVPEPLAKVMSNVGVIVDEQASPWQSVLGLYQGIPLTHREQYGGLAMPDRITIFRLPILRRCRTDDDVRREVRTTVVHEVAHHFGISDRRLEELGWA